MSEMAVTPSAWWTVAGQRAAGYVLDNNKEIRQWTSGSSGRRLEKGEIGRRARVSFSTNSEGSNCGEILWISWRVW